MSTELPSSMYIVLTLCEAINADMTTGSDDRMKADSIMQLWPTSSSRPVVVIFFAAGSKVCVVPVVVVKPIEQSLVLSVATWKWMWPAPSIRYSFSHKDLCWHLCQGVDDTVSCFDASVFIVSLMSLSLPGHSFYVLGGLQPSSSENRPLVIPEMKAPIRCWSLRPGFFMVSLLNRSIKSSNDSLGPYLSNWSGTGVWARIVKSINSLNEKGTIPFSTLKRKVNDGTGTKFWQDSWICDTPLAIKFPRLFRLEINQDCLVSEKWNGEWIWSWSRPIRGGTIGSHLEELQNLVSNVHLGEATDEWQWNVLNQNLFTVKHSRLHVDQLILPSEAPATRWCKSNPKKVNILVWRILRGRIPS
ncbi:RNA-directed DNA polymerase, eukaryota [Artemisia annua]|uniref:RNA-directed DNA polymerase, eukaryota n=1 Tax=Artemisia annua TaxID=35608 RepID=A0A2U1LUB9_ARTAN|nr:RNA-directed DNA polymerase, eukaryota [Artemisia annua]